jgi:hypothetical protein
MILTLALAASAVAAAPQPNDYALPQNWLCLPGHRDACTAPNLDVTEIAADGGLTVRPHTPATAPKADCFYVYPTLSMDPTGNSDMIANDEERRVVAAQFARFGSVCQTYAPLYRQSTLTWLRSNMTGSPIHVDMELRYTDVRDAWRHYIGDHNGGRPFVLIGHSQGSGLLKRLVQEEIEGKPVAKQMLSVMLGGHNLVMSKAKGATGDFKSTPLCTSASQTGCALAWASFRETAPPPENSRYGKPPAPDKQIACTNPAALSGGAAALKAVFPRQSAAFDLTGRDLKWSGKETQPATPFVSLPDLYSGQCKTLNGAHVLAVTLRPATVGGRIADPGGDVKFGPVVAADWGLHLIDMQLVQDDLIALVGSQAAAWASTR